MKKLFSLLLVVVMFASMALVGSAATATNYVTVEVVETADGITCTYYITNPNNCAGFTASLAFPSAKVSADKTTPYTLGEIFAPVVANTAPGSKTGYIKYATAISSASDYVTATGTYEMISFDLTRVDAEAVLTSADFAYGTGLYVAKVAEGTTQLDNVKTPDYYADIVYIDNRAPIVEPDKFINDEGANGGVGTITFFGRVGAEWLDEEYGVIVEGKDFFGAKDGDTVAADATATSTTTFTFGDWDGTFEIVMTNITEKGTAGTKTYQFFVGENVTEEATVVVE